MLTDIKKVERNTRLANDLLCFIKNCSWQEVKDNVYKTVKNWQFSDWETPFVAIANGKTVGMAFVLKTDYYPLPEICPWVTCIFVTEEYRGQRISQKLIDASNAYLKELGFEKSYIPSDIKGLYERYGYVYVKDIINYGGGKDRLYAKNL